ncbi:YhfX family PLP-dependent enzyme [Oceanobacillus sp. 1P07AA]|uniref:YhfX family PLP-dependent enzyme n=1 Tax=Oceanobacillus sp. 1P07AA TaxID=3132293 RepID=UPI0039A47E9E
MFLDTTMNNNRKLVNTAIHLHQQGTIPPNTYVIDLDMVRQNTAYLCREAKKQDIELFFMTKQFGRNELISKAIMESGITKAVAVDPWEAVQLYQYGVDIGHVGHLVQIPKRMIHKILEIEPDYITVFSYENALNISKGAVQLNKQQKILLRIANINDYMFDGQIGGFTLESLIQDIDKIRELKGIEVGGVTSFPCVLIKDGTPIVTSNVLTMEKARNILLSRGIENVEMNMPSASSTATLGLLKKYGATQAEPGHAITGTTPLHEKGGLSEKPAMVYVTEVSHLYNHKSYVFGGGFYSRSHMKQALVASQNGKIKKVPIMEADPTNIDYYGALNTNKVNVGDSVIYAFRTQIFKTNSLVAIVQNLDSNPELLGLYDSTGNSISYSL